MSFIYFDHSATTRCLPEAKDEALSAMTDYWQNPSSLYEEGQAVRAKVEAARETVARVLGASDSKEIVFVAGGTESDNLAVVGTAMAKAKKGRHIVAFSIEHPAVIESLKYLEKQGFEVTLVDPEPDGVIRVDKVEEALREDTILVSVMLANNVVGTVQPIPEISRLVRERGITMHTDAVQAVGWLDVKVDDLGVDLLSLSGHKFHGPKGIGALYIRGGRGPKPIIHGGGQENGRRSGTENVPGILGMAKALEVAESELADKAVRVSGLRDRLVRGVMDRIENVAYLGNPEKRLPGNACFSFDYIEGESLVLNLSMAGVAASSGSACASKSIEPSHVLLGMGLSPVEAHGSLRLTLGRANTEAEVDRFLEVLPSIVSRLREMSPLGPGMSEAMVAESRPESH